MAQDSHNECAITQACAKFYRKYDDIPRANGHFIVFTPSRVGFLHFAGATLRESITQFVCEFERNEARRDYQEVIDGLSDHKIALDIDYDVPARSQTQTQVTCDDSDATQDNVRDFRARVARIADTACDVYFDLFSEVITSRDILIYESIDSRESSRLSAHIVIKRMVPHFTIARLFAQRVAQAFGQGSDIIDMGIYATKHNLRILGCHKCGSVRTKKLVRIIPARDDRDSFDVAQMPFNAHDLWDSLLGTLCPSAPINVCAKLYETIHARIASTRDTRGTNDDSSVLSESVIAEAQELSDTMYGVGTHVVRRAIGSMVLFDRRRASMCNICDRIHTHDNTLIIRAQYDQETGRAILIEMCRKGGQSSRIIGRRDSEIASALEPPREENVEGRCCAHIESYAEPVMRAYPCDARTIFVHAPMKIGKTKALREYTERILREDSRAIFVSFRRAFTNAICGQFPDFTSYLAIRGDLCERRMIVQVESLHRMIPGDYGAPDLVILDEVESILEQLCSGLSAQQMLNFAVFQWLLRAAKRVIVLDAHISARTYAIVGRVRGMEESWLCHNTWQNARGWEYYFTGTTPLWLCTIDECLARGSRIVICANSASEGRTLREMISARSAETRVLYYCAETSARVKADAFADVNSAWTQCDVLIYTPTVTAGVSFEADHFDYIFGYFTDESCTAQTCIQMMGRIRNVAQKRAFICINATRGSLPETRDEILRALNSRKMDIMSRDSPFMIEFDVNGAPAIPDTDYAELCVQNMISRNKSRNNISRELVERIRETGASCELLTRDIFAQIFEREVTGADLQEMVERHRDIANGCLEVAIDEIRSARDLTSDEYEQLRTTSLDVQLARDSDESDTVRAMMRKYELRETYEMRDGELSANFIRMFGLRDIERAFINLRAILQYMARQDDAPRTDAARADAVTIEDALRAMRDVERAKCSAVDGEELNFPYIFERHRLAQCCVRALGFRDIFDARGILESEVHGTIERNAREIMSMKHIICDHFKISARADFRGDFVSICAQIINNMYAMSIVNLGHVYRLKMNKLFTIYEGRIIPSRTYCV